MEFISDYGLFLAKAVTIVAAILVVCGNIASMAMRQKNSSDSELRITLLNNEFDEMETTLKNATKTSAAQKLLAKLKRKEEKKQAKIDKKAQKQKAAENRDKARNKSGNGDNVAAADNDFDENDRKRLYIVDFDGDIRASANDAMRHEISAILTSATDRDQVLVRLESGGGMVHSYGLAASQLQRIRDKGIPLTVSVDKVAASGGYMMACVGNQIISAPFSIVGSIGVLAQIPNLHRLLKDNKIDYEQLSAGEYKRTLTLFGKNTDKGRDKMQQELEETHQYFKDFIRDQRPALDIDKVATGEHWLGTRALDLGLVDKLQTSDDYLMAARKDFDLLHLSYSRRKNLKDKISEMFASLRSQQDKTLDDMQRQLLM